MEPIVIIILIFSVIAHEVAHGYAANALGDPTARLAGRLTLNPIPHIDLMGSIIIPALLVSTHAGMLFGWAKPVPYNPHNLSNKRWGEALVAVAGSATNILLALIFAVITRLTADSLPAASSIASVICYANLFLGMFNLIPFPPMDGYTVLRGILPFHLSYKLRQFEDQVRGFGVGGIFLVLIVFSFLFVKPFALVVEKIFRLLTGM